MLRNVMRRRSWFAACIFAMALVVSALMPAGLAYADGYSIDQVNIDATVATDGSVSVQESRTFDFDGSYHGVYWQIPSGVFNGRYIETTISSVGEMDNGTFVPFVEDQKVAERRMRALVGEQVPIILVSAYDWSDIEESAKEAGADGFISKPLFKSTGALSKSASAPLFLSFSAACSLKWSVSRAKPTMT